MAISSFRSAAALGFLAALASCTGPLPSQDTTEQDAAAIAALLDRVETTFANGDLEGAMTIFTDDAVISAPGAPDIVGHDAIRATYAGMLAALRVEAELTTSEIEVAGDLAYERGTYTLKLTDKASGQVVSDVVNRHLHIFRRQPDGSWKTWRMMVNTAEPAATGAQPSALRVLSSNGLKAVVDDLTPLIEREIGRPLTIEFSTTAALRQDIEAGEAFDVAILTTEAVDALTQSGKIAASSVGALGRSGIGIGVRAGTARRAIGTRDELRATLLAARSLTWVEAGATRPLIERMLETLGIARDVQDKITLASGVEAANESVAHGDVELVLVLTSEILSAPGIDYAGPLPAELQGYISFAGGTSPASSASAAGARVLDLLRAPSAASVYAANGMEQ